MSSTQTQLRADDLLRSTMLLAVHLMCDSEDWLEEGDEYEPDDSYVPGPADVAAQAQAARRGGRHVNFRY